MMKDQEEFQAWLAVRRNARPPHGFSDLVMSSIESQPLARRSHHSRVTSATWFHVAACIAASIVFALRLGCVYSIFIPFE